MSILKVDTMAMLCRQQPVKTIRQCSNSCCKTVQSSLRTGTLTVLGMQLSTELKRHRKGGSRISDSLTQSIPRIMTKSIFLHMLQRISSPPRRYRDSMCTRDINSFLYNTLHRPSVTIPSPPAPRHPYPYLSETGPSALSHPPRQPLSKQQHA